MMAKGDAVYAKPTVVEDPPAPDLDDVQQREPLLPAVAVKIVGPVRTQHLPSRGHSVTADLVPVVATGARPVRILNEDPKRARATIISSVGWLYMSNPTGVQAPIPANVALVVCHADAVWAFIASGSTTAITVISEYFAD